MCFASSFASYEEWSQNWLDSWFYQIKLPSLVHSCWNWFLQVSSHSFVTNLWMSLYPPGLRYHPNLLRTSSTFSLSHLVKTQCYSVNYLKAGTRIPPHSLFRSSMTVIQGSVFLPNKLHCPREPALHLRSHTPSWLLASSRVVWHWEWCAWWRRY